MSQTLDATFDGNVFRPDQPIALGPNTRVRIMIEPTLTWAGPILYKKVSRKGAQKDAKAQRGI